MTSSTGQVFFAYPGSPSLLAETVRSAASKIEKRSAVGCTTWEQLKVDGRVIINEIQSAIDKSKVVVAEVGSLSPNVLFEVGYAMAVEKQVMLLVDSSDTHAVRNWQEFGVLASIGYTSYAGDSERLAAQFAELSPHERADKL